MRRPRVRLWQIMIAVVLIAVLAFAERMRRQRAVCRERATYYATLEQASHKFVLSLKQVLTTIEASLKENRNALLDCDFPDLRRLYMAQIKRKEVQVASFKEDVRKAEEELDRLSRLRMRWERAAARPWLDLPPDPYPRRAD
jgi:hypothetical protein